MARDVYDEVERAGRDSYGRLFACLPARSRDLSSAKDALADALTKALEVWPLNDPQIRAVFECALLALESIEHSSSSRARSYPPMS